MADYFSLLSRAVRNLRSSTPQTREEVYARAREALLSQLRTANPPVPEASIAAQQDALDEAADRLEARVEQEAHVPSAPPSAWSGAKKPAPDERGRGRLGDLPAPVPGDDAPAIPAAFESLEAGALPSATPGLAPDMSESVASIESDDAAPAEAEPPVFPLAVQIEENRSMGQKPLQSIYAPRAVQEKTMSRMDELNRVLRKLQSDSFGVEASALISEDGLMIASVLAPNMEEARVAGMTATLLSLGSRAAVELNRGAVQEVIVRGEGGYAVLIGAGRGALLLALTNESSKLGLVFFDMREAVRSLQKIL